MSNITSEETIEVATLAGGCFWCIESAFNRIKGVTSAVSGYMGGHAKNPNYELICTGTSGYAEVVQIHFNAQEISYVELLEIFFSLHNPTQLNRQGNDIGTQYRSEVYYHSEMQREDALNIIKAMGKAQLFDEPIVTQVSDAVTFYPAENYHQDYVNNNPNNPYCQAVVMPKLAKFYQRYNQRLKTLN